jgi:hypothetical protein
VRGNEALEFEAAGSIELYRNETNLGVYPYRCVSVCVCCFTAALLLLYCCFTASSCTETRPT